jgi:hypothetical protein
MTLRCRVVVVVGLLTAVMVAGCNKTITAADANVLVPPFTGKPVMTFAADKVASNEASLLFVGDTSVARGIADVIDKQGGGDPAYPFARIQPLFEQHDLVFTNLECVVTDSEAEDATQKKYRIRAPIKYAAALKKVGIDVVSVANNHAHDFGGQGFHSTLRTLKQLDVLPVGAQVPTGWDQSPLIVQVGAFKVGFLGYNQHGDEYEHGEWRPASAAYDIDRVAKDVARAKPLVDFLVVSVHGGNELGHETSPWQEADAKRVIDAGADAWIGHHAHAVQPYASYKGKVIAYSLGDFLFDKTSAWIVERNRPRLFLSIKLARAADGTLTITPTYLPGDQEPNTYRPFQAPGYFNVDSFAVPPQPPSKTFRDAVLSATVSRIRGGVSTACDRVEKKRVRVEGHHMRWLYPRLGCDKVDHERKRPWETVGASAEFFNGTIKPGIWAHPHAGGPLRLVFPAVTLGTALRGFGGVPDWGVTLKEKPLKKTDATPTDITMTITVGSQPPTTIVVPYQRGTTPVDIDTSAWSGQAHDVTIDISGGSGDVEGRFLFDLQVSG